MSVFVSVDDFFHSYYSFLGDFGNSSFCKIVCFDYGTKKIGVAVSDNELNFSFPKDILLGNWIDLQLCYLSIKKICENYNCKFVVFGFPKTLDGSYNDNCKRIIEISNFLDKDGFEILLFDERFSTKAGLSVFKYEKKRSNDKKNNINKQIGKHDDAKAASIILGDVLRLNKFKSN